VREHGTSLWLGDSAQPGGLGLLGPGRRWRGGPVRAGHSDQAEFAFQLLARCAELRVVPVRVDPFAGVLVDQNGDQVVVVLGVPHHGAATSTDTDPAVGSTESQRPVVGASSAVEDVDLEVVLRGADKRTAKHGKCGEFAQSRVLPTLETMRAVAGDRTFRPA